ncbi:hypothetical protein D9619_009599 [Psilocybe cf. subviscida]|uniref:Mg2+ transporter protein, CorA-like/Zinc transport protein ZntB n=1 Tax=Psilocybe cf. subviscida TaxID=2480587 RepID=A0A8H5BKV7_9AGAR|nr:hypothetical protein D9619_009599 [Psilocybe cf. subviscida]
MTSFGLPEYREDKTRVPHPSHRHASPSAPWPWVDLEDEVDANQLESPLPPTPPLCSHNEPECKNCWKGYPRSQFPNWTHRQVIKSKIDNAIRDYNKASPCVLHRMDVDKNGLFTNPGSIVANHGEESRTWRKLAIDKVPDGIRVRAMFIENMSGPILQMLGAKFNLEPFFWSSSLSWTPSRYQEEIQSGIGDHITITLTFLRSMSNHDAIQLNEAIGKSTDNFHATPTLLGSQMIDPHAPLVLHSNTHRTFPDERLLVLDLLAVHLIRKANGSTLISFHPTLNIPTTTAAFLHERIRFAGQSVYWQNIFQKSPDPTFVLLTFIWHALYAWDEALENLFSHICSLEARIIHTSEMLLTRELHIIRAHHLYYVSLLDDFRKHVKFIRDTHNPLMEGFPEELQKSNKKVMDRECESLLNECERLKSDLVMQERRLKNVMGLVFSSVNIQDSRYMREMTEAAVRDSAAVRIEMMLMKQIAYMIMIFLPATFVACVFGMNVSEFNPGSLGTIPHYIAIALPLTLVTAWIIIAFQSTYIFPPNTGFILRLAWPAYLVYKMMAMRMKKEEGSDADSRYSLNIV